MATDRALANAYSDIKGQLQYQRDHELAQELSDLCDELVLMIKDEDLQWQLRKHKKAERWVVVREGGYDAQVYIARALGGIDHEGGFLVGKSEWDGYYYSVGKHYDTAEEAQAEAEYERARRIEDREREFRVSKRDLEETKARTIKISDKVWDFDDDDDPFSSLRTATPKPDPAVKKDMTNMSTQERVSFWDRISRITSAGLVKNWSPTEEKTGPEDKS